MFELLTRKNDLSPLFTDLFDDVWRTTNNLSRNLGVELPYNVNETENDYTLEGKEDQERKQFQLIGVLIFQSDGEKRSF